MSYINGYGTLNRVDPGPATLGDGRGPVLLGVKRQDWRDPEGGRGLGRKLAERGEIAYWVVSAEQSSQAEQRADRRAQRARANPLTISQAP